MQATGGTLVVGPAWVGDMVMAQSLFKTLAARFPQQPIDVLAPTWSQPLLQRMPEVRHGIELAVGHGEIKLRQRLAIGRRLLHHRYQRAAVLPRSFKAALPPFAARIPQRTGYRGELRYGLINDPRPLDKTRLTQTVQRFVALGCDTNESLPPPIPNPDLLVDRDNQQRLVGSLGLSLATPVIALLPGAEYGPAKQWPVEKFAELAKQLAPDGKQCWVLGSANEIPLGEQVAHAAGEQVTNLCGETELVDVVDLLALCETAVTNDSGLMHIAAAVGCKIVAIYGSSSPQYTPPLTTKQRVISLNLACSPCFKRHCPLGHTHCLQHIGADQVAKWC